MQEVQSTLPIGTVVRDRYIVEELLGKGGFGAVYLVRDQRVHHNLFALKEVVDPNKRERARFVFEAELLRRLDHPALPRVYYVFDDPKKDRAYMLMDYVEGPNLEMLRQKQPNKRFPVQQVLSIMSPIMQAVDYLHQQHPPIIHRDIKPANIIVPTSGIGSVLVDFGIAKEYDPESTTTAIRHASPGYGAPEQYGTGTNTHTDIYGLGATIYALLTGVVPADAFFRATQQGSKGTDPLEPIHQHVSSIPRHIEQAVYRAMAIDSNARFASAGAFWEALNAEPLAEPLPEPVVIAKPVAQAVPALGERYRPQVEQATTVSLQKSPRRRRNRIGALLLLALALLIAGVSLAVVLPSLVGHHEQVSSITPTAHVQHKSMPTTVPTHASTPTATATTRPRPSPSPTPSPTPVPAPGIPNVAGSYTGTIVDNLTHPPTSASMSLSINQSQGSISGYFSVSPPLIGSNPFAGSVTSKYSIEFLVQGAHGNPPLFFTGTVQQNGTMSGNYCSYVNNQCDYGAGGYGTWSVTPTSPGGSGSSVVPSNTPMDYRLRPPVVA